MSALSPSGGNRFGLLDYYLEGRSIPNERSAFFIGEALRPDVPWCNGMLLLWLCGHYDVLIHALALWIRNRSQGRNWESEGVLLFDIIWECCATATAITKPNPLDSVDSALRHAYLRKNGLDMETTRLLVPHSPKFDIASIEEAEDSEAPDVVTFAYRERMKRPWCLLTQHIAKIEPIVSELAPPRKHANSGSSASPVLTPGEN